MDDKWIEDAISKHSSLTSAIKATITSLLETAGIEYLSVTGRTKSQRSIEEKVIRKGYSNPRSQMTDITGLRVIVYFESDLPKVNDLLKGAFNVDTANSLDQKQLLATNQNGYRSVHYVCDIGDHRGQLPEFAAYRGLKFEIQVRTVLQHAWAEIAHDRNYKFTGTLPPDIERELFLYAGMLEIADRGFDSISRRIDEYVQKSQQDTSAGNLDIPIDSITLPQFVEEWARKSGFKLKKTRNTSYGELVDELRSINVTTIKELSDLIPRNYVEIVAEHDDGETSTNLFGVTRDWMVISKYKELIASKAANWEVSNSDLSLYRKFLSEAAVEEIASGMDRIEPPEPRRTA